MHLDPTVLEPPGEGVPLLDLGGPRDDVAVHPFGNRIAALQRRERAEQIQAPADRPKPVPLTADLARAACRERVVDMLETLSVRLDAPAQATRRHPFSESFDSFHCAAHDVVDFLDQALLRVIHAGGQFDRVGGNELRRRAWCRGAHVRDEIHDRYVGLVADCAHDGDAARRHRARQAFVVEAPEVLEGAASARTTSSTFPFRGNTSTSPDTTTSMPSSRSNPRSSASSRNRMQSICAPESLSVKKRWPAGAACTLLTSPRTRMRPRRGFARTVSRINRASWETVRARGTEGRGGGERAIGSIITQREGGGMNRFGGEMGESARERPEGDAASRRSFAASKAWRRTLISGMSMRPTAL